MFHLVSLVTSMSHLEYGLPVREVVIPFPPGYRVFSACGKEWAMNAETSALVGEELSRKGAKAQSATAFLRVFFAPLRLCARQMFAQRFPEVIKQLAHRRSSNDRTRCRDTS